MGDVRRVCDGAVGSRGEANGQSWRTFIATMLVPQKKKGDTSNAILIACWRVDWDKLGKASLSSSTNTHCTSSPVPTQFTSSGMPVGEATPAGALLTGDADAADGPVSWFRDCKNVRHRAPGRRETHAAVLGFLSLFRDACEEVFVQLCRRARSPTRMSADLIERTEPRSLRVGYALEGENAMRRSARMVPQ